MIPATGGTAIQVTDDPSGDWGPSWSPDGTKIAFFSIRTGNYDVFVIDVPNAGIIDGGPTNTWGEIKGRFQEE